VNGSTNGYTVLIGSTRQDWPTFSGLASVNTDSWIIRFDDRLVRIQQDVGARVRQAKTCAVSHLVRRTRYLSPWQIAACGQGCVVTDMMERTCLKPTRGNPPHIL